MFFDRTAMRTGTKSSLAKYRTVYCRGRALCPSSDISWKMV